MNIWEDNMKKTIKDYNLKNKKVIIRCDLNVPIENGVITDDTRITESLETIKYAIRKKAKVIILSHLGRIKEENDKKDNSLKIVAKRLEELLEQPVNFIPFTRGKEVEYAINNMGIRDVVMLENTRFEDLNNESESKNNEELAKYWASLGDIYINDAFGTAHRSHASNVGIASVLPSGVGFLIQKEIEEINGALNNPKRPLVILLGGLKVADKIGVIENAVKIADALLIGGGMSYTFFKSFGYDVGLSVVDDTSLDFCKRVYEENKNKIKLPSDMIIGKSISEDTESKLTTPDKIGPNEMGLDIGTKTINDYKKILVDAKTIIWCGPVGVFELNKFSQGTRKITETLSNSKAKIIIGGGDTAAAVNKFGFNNRNAHISTGGGASLEMLEGKELPGIKCISDK
jgi:phosphoglycerate kinase